MNELEQNVQALKNGLHRTLNVIETLSKAIQTLEERLRETNRKLRVLEDRPQAPTTL